MSITSPLVSIIIPVYNGANYLKEAIESALGMKANKELLPIQPGDVPDTFANVDDLVSEFNYKPSTPIKLGVENFVKWYRKHYKV